MSFETTFIVVDGTMRININNIQVYYKKSRGETYIRFGGKDYCATSTTVEEIDQLIKEALE